MLKSHWVLFYMKENTSKWIILLILIIGLFMTLIDATAVNVSIPTIIKDLNASLPDVEWIISGYSITFAAFLIVSGRIGDLYGRRNMFILGVFLFGFTSFLSSEASNISVLIIARLFQGVAGAIISPNVLSIISSTFKGKDRSIAFGSFGATSGIAVALGPILGGFFTTYYSWRWIFRLNIPLSILGIILAFIFIPDKQEKLKEKLDIPGLITSSIGLLLLVFSLIEGQTYGWITSKTNFSILGYNYTGHTSIILYSLILSGIFLILFIYIQYIKSKKNLEPAIDLSFFRFRTYRYGLIAISIISLGEFSALFTLPIYLQIVRGLNALQSGLLTLPLAFGALVAAPIAAFGVNKIGTKIIVSSGIFLEGLGIFLVSNISPNMKLYTLLPALLILGLGIGLAISQNTQVILSEIPHNKSGSASGVLNTIRQVGSSMGVALIGAILSAGLSTNVQNNLNKISNVPSSVKTQIISEINSNNFSTSTVSMPSVPLQIRENKYLYQKYIQEEETIGNNIKNAVDDGITTSISNSIRFASIFLLLGFILSLFIPNIKGHEDNDEK